MLGPVFYHTLFFAFLKTVHNGLLSHGEDFLTQILYSNVLLCNMLCYESVQKCAAIRALTVHFAQFIVICTVLCWAELQLLLSQHLKEVFFGDRSLDEDEKGGKQVLGGSSAEACGRLRAGLGHLVHASNGRPVDF